MSPRLVPPAALLVSCLVAVVHGGAGRTTTQEPRPQFRAVVDAVTIDAFAHHSGQPLTGLTKADFIVRDNGVEQRIDSIGATDSAHVIVGLDLSGSVDGAVLEQLRAAVRGVTRQLTDRDRLSLFTFSNRIRVLARAQAPDAALEQTLDQLHASGSTTLHDAVVVGSVLARADQRPAALLLFTDGEDTSSWNTVTRSLDILRRTDVVVYPVGAGLPAALINPPTTAYFRHRTWVAPTPGDAVRMLQQLADLSGGEFLRVNRRANLAETFRGILAQYRQRYLITYTPSDSSPPGWHRLDVRLRNRPGTVVAREGYVAR